MVSNKLEQTFKFANDKNIERAERVLMQALVQDAVGVDLILTKLEPKDFFGFPFNFIFQTAQENYSEGNKLFGSVLLEAVKFKLDTDSKTQREIEGLFEDVLLKGLPFLERDIKVFVDVVKKASIFRQLKQFAKKVEKEEFKVKDDRFEGYLQAIQNDFTKIIHSAFVSIPGLSYDEIGREEEELIRKVYRGELTVKGLKSGFYPLDQLTSGWKEGELIVVAARPGRGKTALLINFLQGAVNDSEKFDKNKDVLLFFSLEMRNREIYQRHLMLESQVNYTLTSRQRLANVYDDLIKASEVLRDLPIKIFDYSTITLDEIRAQITEVSKTNNVKLVVIDYLQLVNAFKNSYNISRQQEVTMISKSLKSFAKEFNVPIIAAAQLSRRIEERKDSRPILSDLRESGSIEQDADMVLFIHRVKDEDSENQEAIGHNNIFQVELILEKNRSGPTGKVQFDFQSDVSTFRVREYNPDGYS